MLRLVFTGHILIILTAAVKAGEFLQPWTAGPSQPYKDYSNNVYYTLGSFIQTAWEADYTNVIIAFNQDNNPGDARGGPVLNLESISQFYLSPTSRSSSSESVAESYNKTT